MDESHQLESSATGERPPKPAGTRADRFDDWLTSPIAVQLVRFAWVPIPLFLVAILALRFINMPITAEPWYLLPLLNAVFLTSVAVVVAYLACVGFMQSGSLPVLLFGSGTLIFGISSFVAGFTIGSGHLNEGLTIHNMGVFLAALCHVPASAVAVSGMGRVTRRLGAIQSLAYGAALAVVAAIVCAAFMGWIPPFIEPTAGPTLLRTIVLGSSVALYGLAALMVCAVTGKRAWVFGWWYGLALGLIATGLLGVMIVDRVGDVVGWAGRICQYLGGLYMGVAVLLVNRDSGRWDTMLQLALRESEARLRIRAEATFEGIAVVEEGEIVDANDQLAHILGYERGGLVGVSIRDIIPEEYPDLEHTKSGQTLDVTREYAVVRPDAQRIHVEVRSRTMPRKGRTVRYYAIRDITERTRQEEALRENEKRVKIATSAAGLGVFVWYPKEDVTFWETEQVYTMVGHTREDGTLSRASFFAQYLLPEDAPALDLALREAMKPGGSIHTTFRLRRKNDGEVRCIEMFGRFDTTPNGTTLRLVGVVADITERRAAEEALRQARDDLELRVSERTAQLQNRADQLARLTSELTLAEQRERRRLAQILHDHLQQLLVGAKFGLEVLSRNVPDNQKGAVDQLLSLLAESITASRSLTVELFPPILHEGGLAAGLEWLARWIEDKHGLKVHLSADPDAVTSREDVRVLLFQSVRELLFNVVKHAHVREAQVDLARQDRFLMIAVEDGGVGFEPNTLREEYSLDRAGFGLVSIRERLAMLGGSFEIESAVGHGARFVLTAPIHPQGPSEANVGRDSAETRPVEAIVVPDMAVSFGDGIIRVLLVDDHAVMRQGLSFLLSHEIDVEVVGEASDGHEALTKARELRPDVILMDFSMPRLDGLEATRRIHAELPDIRIIGLSMYEEADRAQAMIEAGAEAYLSKSGDSDILLAEIRGANPRMPAAR